MFIEFNILTNNIKHLRVFMLIMSFQYVVFSIGRTEFYILPIDIMKHKKHPIIFPELKFIFDGVLRSFVFQRCILEWLFFSSSAYTFHSRLKTALGKYLLLAGEKNSGGENMFFGQEPYWKPHWKSMNYLAERY